MFIELSQETKKQLWLHQADALGFAIRRLKNANQRDVSLIRMPTGTGKTGVIACLACISNPRSTLILTPWRALVDQLVNDMNEKFWKHSHITAPKREVVALLPSKAPELLKKATNRVFVATFSTLNTIRRENEEIYEHLSRQISLVIVDECHYEPAVQWGKSVKGLNQRTLLLTATPYRNDLKLFQIENPKASTKHFTHAEAVRRKIIRDVSFRILDSPTEQMRDLAEAFARFWNSRKRPDFPATQPKAIICCETASDIETVVHHLRSKNLAAIGIHEQFDGKKAHLKKDVPNPEREDATIWVHQKKLGEGLDDARFCCLGLFTTFQNDRRLIQQIGRVLRRKEGEPHKPAYVVAPRAFSHEGEWKAYLDFEKEAEVIDPKHFRTAVEKALKAQPKVEYFGGRFRRRFEPDKLAEDPQVIIPPSVLVRERLNNFTLSGYVQDCTDTLNIADAIILGADPNKPCQKADRFALWVYASVRNSRALLNSSFYEITIETHCVMVDDKYVFVADSAGNYPTEVIDDTTKRVPINDLQRFIGTGFRPTNVTTVSSLPYDLVTRSTQLAAQNLRNIPASISDRVQICRALRGTSDKKIEGRRYVGMNKARLRSEISEARRRTFNLKEFMRWTEAVAAVLKSSKSRNELFQRYMPSCAPPAKPVPKTISVNLLEEDLNIQLPDGEGCTLECGSSNVSRRPAKIEKGGIRPKQTFDFSLHFKSGEGALSPLELQMTYQENKERFWFRKAKGPGIQVEVTKGGKTQIQSFADYLNENQGILLVGLDDGETVYQGSNFYKVDYSYAERTLVELIETPLNAPTATSEKGLEGEIHKYITSFPKGSLFQLIADQKIGLPFTPDTLICDDMGTECADFVAVDFDNEALAFIHAKDAGGGEISASKFHEVVAQALKNLVYWTRTALPPDKSASWTGSDYWRETRIKRVLKRRKPDPTGTALWRKIQADILQRANPRLYIVLVTSGCCDPVAVTQAVNDKRHRTSETGQLIHLLGGLHAVTREHGATLLIKNIRKRKFRGKNYN